MDVVILTISSAFIDKGVIKMKSLLFQYLLLLSVV